MTMHLELDPESTDLTDLITTEEPITVKIYIQGNAVIPNSIRIELVSEVDVQLYYQATIKEENFR
jgi:hypothetical protein